MSGHDLTRMTDDELADYFRDALSARASAPLRQAQEELRVRVSHAEDAARAPGERSVTPGLETRIIECAFLPENWRTIEGIAAREGAPVGDVVSEMAARWAEHSWGRDDGREA